MRTTTLVGVMSGALLLAACNGDNGVDDDTDDPDDEAAAGDVGEGETISIGWMPWEEAIAVTNLWNVILEENGYEVNQEQLEPGIVFDGVATGDLDLFLDAWLPATHASYMDQYGDDIEDLGEWLDEAPLTLSVPEYVDEVDSIDDLADNADLFDSQIVGIESGAGHMEITENEVMPAYGLDDWELVDSSTPAMLSELGAAIDNEEPIVVTLWQPHPAYAEFDLKDLEDPEMALGEEADQIHALARTGFGEDHPEVAAALENFEFDHDGLNDLSATVLEEEGQELENAQAWLDDNRDLVEGWLEGTDLAI